MKITKKEIFYIGLLIAIIAGVYLHGPDEILKTDVNNVDCSQHIDEMNTVELYVCVDEALNDLDDGVEQDTPTK